MINAFDDTKALGQVLLIPFDNDKISFKYIPHEIDNGLFDYSYNAPIDKFINNKYILTEFGGDEWNDKYDFI